MVEPPGIRALTIARLKKRLKIIKKQMTMSRKYPDHQKKLRQKLIAYINLTICEERNIQNQSHR